MILRLIAMPLWIMYLLDFNICLTIHILNIADLYYSIYDTRMFLSNAVKVYKFSSFLFWADFVFLFFLVFISYKLSSIFSIKLSEEEKKKVIKFV